MADTNSSHVLHNIQNNLSTVIRELDTIDTKLQQIDSNVEEFRDELGDLAKEFNEFVGNAKRQHELAIAETRIVKIRQELETKFGHYAIIRRTTTGILQADDLEIVRKETISAVTEELMLTTPNYWLTPCLVALAAWIGDQKALAEKALIEGIKRNDEKTSLLFALICRRAGRKAAALKWAVRYLAGQDEDNLNRHCVIILDAYANGLLGDDAEGIILKQMNEWLDRLSQKADFVEQQISRWSEAILIKRRSIDANSYQYLRQYSATWPVLCDIMEYANMHADILNYFQDIFSRTENINTLKEQLDQIMSSLVTDFDDEELPLRRDEKLNQYTIDFQGDLNVAKRHMQVEQSAFFAQKDFAQLLIDAAMNPKFSDASISTRKFAIALSKPWIVDAYKDIVASNRMKIPHTIQIDIATYHETTTDGQNEEELLAKFYTQIDKEKQEALAKIVDSSSIYGILVCLFLLTIIFFPIGIVSVVIFGVWYLSKKKVNKEKRAATETQFEERRNNEAQILRAILAEVVDFRAEFSRRDQESQKVISFLAQVSPDQYVRRLSDATRRIKLK
jgi:hypothetical protein